MIRFILLTLTVVAATMGLIVQGYISYDNPLVAGVVNQYGAAVSRLVRVEVIYPGVVRGGILTPGDLAQIAEGHWTGLNWRELEDHETKSGMISVVAVPPDASQYSRLIKNCLDHEVRVVIESSGMDAWHSTAEGLIGLKTLTPQALRVVIFDGGHHLPTLGLRPDLLIVPVTMGYIAHGHTRDAMRIADLITVLRREQIDCPVVALPRWGLVKTPASMNWVAIKALLQLPAGKSLPSVEGQIVGPRSTRYGQAMFLYVTQTQKQDLEWLKSGGRHGLKRVYVAFNFNSVSQDQAQEFLERLQQSGLQVELVNEPLHVAGVILRGGMRCISAPRP